MSSRRPHIRLVSGAPKLATTPPTPGPKPMARSALVRRAQQGDPLAFETLAREHYAAIYRFAAALTGQEAEAADVAQDALIKAFRAIGSYRFEAPFRSWLFQITRNAWRDRLRREAAQENKRREYALDQQLPPSRDPARELEAAEVRALIHRALEAVEPRFREILVLFDLEGLAYRDIAEVCGLPIGTVKSRLKRGRDALRQVLTSAQDPQGLSGEEGTA